MSKKQNGHIIKILRIDRDIEYDKFLKKCNIENQLITRYSL